jgi:Bacterial Ig domain
VSTGTEEGIGESLPTLAESAGAPAGALGIPAFVWLSAQGVEVRFARGLAEAGGNGVDTTTRVLVGPGAGKSGLQMASAGEAISVAWQEVTASGHGVIKLRGVAQDAGLLGAEITVGGGASELSHHSLSISGYVLHSAEVDGRVGAAAGVNLVWVASDATDAPGVGRIMMQRFGVLHSESGTPTQLVPIANGAFQKISHHADVAASLRGAANDNLVWVGDEDGSGGVMGRLPTVASLDTGDVLVAWIGSEGHVHGKLYGTAKADGASAQDYVAVNAALADLTPHYGRDGDGQAFDARRVKATDLGAGNFALVWMVAAGADAMLNGSVFSLRIDASLADTATADWVEDPMTPVALPAGFTGEFNLSLADGQNSDLVLSYEAADSAGNVTTTAVAQKISTADAALDVTNAPSEAGTPDKAGLAVNKVAFYGDPASGGAAPESHDSFAVNTNSLPLAETASAAAPPAARAGEASGLIVTANGDGLAVAWTLAGRSDDLVVLKVKIPSDTSDTEDGTNTAEDGWVIDVTDSADPDVAPGVARIGPGGVVVAWVDAPSGELRTQTYSAHGQAQTASSITVSSGHTVSDIALTSIPAAPPQTAPPQTLPPQAAPSDAEQEAASAPDGNQIALAWVEDADADGYGSIMLQRYLVQPNADDGGADDEGEHHALVELGRDGQVDGNDDPEPFSVDVGDGPEPVVGRAPQLTGLPLGELAICWVEDLGSQETVRGAILERDSGRAILNIDLSDQLDEPAVVAKGTQPILSSSANGDLLVSWLEPDGNGGFDVKAAIYKAAGENAWLIPDKVVELQHFASEPQDFSVGLTGDAEPAILLTWDDSNYARGQRFDLEGNELGNRFVLRDGQVDTVSDTASLPDGRIVVVYAEQDKDGDVDIESHVVVTIGDESHVVVTTGDDSLANTSDADAGDHIFGDRGTLDTHAGLGDYGSFSQVSSLDKDITVAEDATDGVIIDVLEDQVDGGLRVVQVNGADLAIGAPLRVEHGFVQLRGDGDLLFTADEHFHGTVNFEYTVSNEEDRLATGSVAVNVTPVEDDPMPVDLAFDQAHETASLGEASAAYLDRHDDNEASQDSSAEGNQHADAGDGGSDANETPYDATDADLGDDDGAPGTADGATTSAIAAMDDAPDTLAFAPRYENDGSRDSFERQWLQLAEDETSYGGKGDQDGARHDNDTFVFHTAFGNDAAAESRALHQVIDLSKSGYPTFQALQDAGALVQVGGDVEITLNAADPAHPEKILLRSVDLSTLTANDFKFS